MPRIRSIKPEALQHRKVGRLSDRAFRLWIGMLTQADDHGRLVADTSQLKLIAFGYQTRTGPRQIEAALAELSGTGLIRLYEIDGRPLAEFPSWQDHQRVDHPSKSLLPSFSAEFAKPREASRSLASVPGGSDGSDGSLLSPATAGQATATGSPRQGPKASACDSFEQFWAEWPTGRRVGKADALKAWRALNPTEELRSIILAALRHQKQLSDWQREGGRFIPYPHRWLNKRRWEDSTVAAPDPYAKFPRVGDGEPA